VKRIAIHLVYGWLTSANGSGLGLRDFAEFVKGSLEGAEYFTHTWDDCSPAEVLAKSDGFDAIVLIGHSYGGQRVKQLCDEFEKQGVDIPLVLMLDPVPRLFNGMLQSFFRFIPWHIAPSAVKVLEFHQRNEQPRGVPFAARQGLTEYDVSALQNRDGSIRHPGHCDIPSDPYVQEIMADAINELAGE
jgi:hypothetical protein